MAVPSRRLLDLYVPTFAISFAQGMVLPGVPALAAHFGVLPGVAAQIVTAQAAGRMLALVPAGVLVDRLGPAAAILAGVLCIAAGALCMLVPLFAGVLAGQVLVGIGASLWQAGREISGLELVPAQQRGRLMSTFFGLQLAGLAAGPVAGGMLVDAGGLTLLFFAHLALAMGVLLLVALERPGAARAATAVPVWSFGGLREITPPYRLTFAILTFATFAMTLYRSSLNSLLPVYAGVTVGLSAARIGTLFGMMSVGVMGMIVPAGLILDRAGRKWAAVPAALLPALVFAVLPLARDALTLTGLVVALGLANGLSLGSLSTFSYDVIPERARGRLQALRRVVGDVGSVTGPLVGGLLADRYGAGVAFAAIAPLLAITALLLAFGARETLAPRPAPLTQVDEAG